MFQRIVKFCDEMMASAWQPCYARPKYEMQGCLVIGRWFDDQKTWAILYVGQGCIRDLLESRFRASSKWSIGMYLSSFPKRALRKLIWVKWRKDPYYPREVWISPAIYGIWNGLPAMVHQILIGVLATLWSPDGTEPYNLLKVLKQWTTWIQALTHTLRILSRSF